MVGDVLCFGILLFTFAFYLRIALSWFPARTGGPMMQVREAAFTVTEPVLLPLRRAIPPLPGGGGRVRYRRDRAAPDPVGAHQNHLFDLSRVPPSLEFSQHRAV